MESTVFVSGIYGAINSIYNDANEAQQSLVNVCCANRGSPHMSKEEAVTKEEIEERINQAVQKLFERLGFGTKPSDVKELLAQNSQLPPEKQIPKGIELGLQLGFGSFANTVNTGIRTRDDLEKVLHIIGEAAEQAPTLARGALTQTLKNLPRRGGPGRIPKLDPKESAKVCDQIGLFIRQKCTLKEALAKTSALCPTLLGKRVGSRTLQKAWDKRDEFTGI
jgi:hypothetical protein